MTTEIDFFRRRMNRIKANAEGFSDIAAGPTRCSGQFVLNGPGEAQVQLAFPVKFSDAPRLSSGFEVREGDMLTVTKMPTMTMSVVRWLIDDRPPYSNMYTGAVLGVVTTGPAGQRLLVTWHMDGTAYSNPV